MKKKMLLSLLMAISVMTTTVYAEEMNEAYQQEIMTMTTALRDLLNEDKEIIYENIKNDVRENEWDYDLTMSSFREQDAFKDVDYMDMIAAYMTCKHYYIQNGKVFTSLRDVPLISYTAEEVSIEDFIPIRVPAYTEIEEGIYKQKPVGVYITRNTTIDKFIQTTSGNYIKDGKEDITLERQNVKYGQVEMSVMSVSELFDYYGVVATSEYEHRLNELSRNTGNAQIYQIFNAKIPGLRKILDLDSLAGSISEDKERQNIATVATSLIGQVPYLWGGKPTRAGYDHTWWLYNENNEQNGLDCSGFVEWVYMTAGYEPKLTDQMHSTGLILNSDFIQITEDELETGDIGVSEGTLYNHTGIYLGQKDGKEMWVHCNSSDNTVAVTEHSFQKFYSPLTKLDNTKKNNEHGIDKFIKSVYSTYSSNYSDDDVYTVAQLVTHEAGSEGFNGWVAVAEIIKNRIDSPLYPNTVDEVVFQKGQFSYVSNIKKIKPSQEVIDTTREVLAGKISILDNPDCLYFRNPQITSDISVTEEKAWGNLPWYMAVGNHAFYLQN